MGFTFRKLYPSIVRRGCCDLTIVCPCPGCERITIIIEFCTCPLAIVTSPCLGNPAVCSGQRCTSGGSTWNSQSGTPNLDLTLCTIEEGLNCICESYTTSRCTTWQCEANPPEYPECCVDYGCFVWPYPDPLDNPITRTNLDCTVQGATPYTYMIENLSGMTSHTCLPSMTIPRAYETFYLEDYDDTEAEGPTGVIGDPAFTFNRQLQRFVKSPAFPSGNEFGTPLRIEFTPFCINLDTTITQEAGIQNRTMVISGRNIYRYTGHFSGDLALAHADPFWDSPGGSGIKQLEESISGRSFPLPDSVLQFPLWGQEYSTNANVDPGPDCNEPYRQCDEEGLDLKCVGCKCLRTGPIASLLEPGHYLPNDQGYTAGYFSFASFNPDSYLDHYDFTGQIVGPGGRNLLGFGNVSNQDGYSIPAIKFNCDDDGTNCIGCSGATSHGPRLGVPTCSVWSLVNALYWRVYYAITNNHSGADLDPMLPSLTGMSETTFRTQNAPDGFSRFAQAVANLLAANPSSTTNGTSNVQYHLAKIKEGLKLDSSVLFETYFGGSDYFDFTFPNVFLWDPVEYQNVGGSEKWKHLYVVGNGNVIYDSRSVSITGPYSIYSNEAGIHEDILAQDYQSSVFYLNEVTHDRQSSGGHGEFGRPLSRVFVFPGSGGPIGNAPDITRRNAIAKVRLRELPFCGGMTGYDGIEIQPISLCSICNASWNNSAVCLKDRTPEGDPVAGDGINSVTQEVCSPVTEIFDENGVVEYFSCGYRGGRIIEENSLTASYQL